MPLKTGGKPRGRRRKGCVFHCAQSSAHCHPSCHPSLVPGQRLLPVPGDAVATSPLSSASSPHLPPPPKLPPSIMGGDCFNPHPRSLPQLRTPTRVSLFSLHLLGKGMEEKSHLWAAPARGHRRYFSVLTGSSVSCYCVIRLCLQRQLESSQGSLSVTMFLSYSSFSLQGSGWIHNLNSTASYAFPPCLPAPALTGHGTWEDPCHLLPSTCLQRLYPGACSRKHENWARRAGPLLESQARRRDGAFTIC